MPSLSDYIWPRGFQPQYSAKPNLPHPCGVNIIDYWYPAISQLTPVNSPSAKITPDGMAFAGNGSTSYYKQSKNITLTSSQGFTFLCVINGTDTTLNKSFIGYTLATGLQYIVIAATTSNNVLFQVSGSTGNASIASTAPALDGKTHVIVGVVTSSQFTFYMDGVLQGVASVTLGTATINTLTIGAIIIINGTAYTYNATGVLGMALLNRALSNAEALSIARPPDFWNMFAPPLSIPFL